MRLASSGRSLDHWNSPRNLNAGMIKLWLYEREGGRDAEVVLLGASNSCGSQSGYYSVSRDAKDRAAVLVIL